MQSVLKWMGITLGTLLGLLIIGTLALYGAGRLRLYKKYEVSVQLVPSPTNSESLQEGKRIFQYRGCEACHGEQLQGLVYLDNPALGQVITLNLTAGPGASARSARTST